MNASGGDGKAVGSFRKTKEKKKKKSAKIKIKTT